MSVHPYVDRYQTQRSLTKPDVNTIPVTQWHWSYYCTTEQAGIDEYGVGQPPTCYNDPDRSNPTHVITSMAQNEAYTPNFYRRERERYITNQHYRVKTVSVDAPAGQTVSSTFDFLYPVNIVRFGFTPSDSDVGNVVDVSFRRDMAQGVLFKQYAKGTKDFEVSVEFMAYINIGYGVTIQDGTNTTDLGEVVSIDLPNNAFTTQNGSSADFSESATLTVTKPLVQQYEIGSIEQKSYSFDLYTYKDPSFTGTVTYTNSGTEDAHFVFEYEIAY